MSHNRLQNTCWLVCSWLLIMSLIAACGAPISSSTTSTQASTTTPSLFVPGTNTEQSTPEVIQQGSTVTHDTNGDGPISDPGGGGVVDPGWTFGPHDPPVTMRIGQRTKNSLSVGWQNLSSSQGPLDLSGGDINKLIRQKEDGPWEVVTEFGQLTGWTNYTDTGLEPDTRYCYRVRVENEFAYGSRTTLQPNQACGYTRGAKSLKVWRAQLTIRTADVADAGTGDSVKVLLNSPLITYAPSGNSTWLDYGPRIIGSIQTQSGTVQVWSDDFDRGREFTYDLNLSDISELSDITMITIAKEGTNALGIAEISLKINGVEVFERLFGETASTCLWIDEDDGYSPIYSIWQSELRAHPGWQGYIASPPAAPFVISNDEIVSRLESMIGNEIHGTGAYWDKDQFYPPAWVEATRLDNETLQVDVDLGADVPILSDPEVDLDFRLQFETACNPQAGTATLKITTTNFSSNVDFGILQKVITLGIVEFLEHDIAKGIENAFQPITQTIVLDTGGVCPTVVVDELGNIRFQLP
jgi:hypothetical protein